MEKTPNNNDKKEDTIKITSNYSKKELEKDFQELLEEKNSNEIDGLDLGGCGSKNRDDLIFKNNNKETPNNDSSCCNNKKEKDSCCKEEKETNKKDGKKNKNKQKEDKKPCAQVKKFISKYICQKCSVNKSNYYVRQEYFCKDCFLKSNEHKFRSNLRAHCKIRHEDNLLVCLSGGINSMLMLYLFNLSLNESNSTKKMFFKIQFLFIDDSFYFTDYKNNKNKEALLELRKENQEALKKLSEIHQFKIHTINLEYCFELGSLNKDNSIVHSQDLVDTTNFDLIDKLISNVSEINNINYQNQYSGILVKNLIYYYSINHSFNKIILGDSQTSQINNVFNDLINGRGNNIVVSYVDNTTLAGKISILFPMMDYLEKEILILSRIYKIDILKSSIKNISSNKGKGGKPFLGDHSLLIKNFLNKLQEKSFPTTPTIISTAEKLITEPVKDLEKDTCKCCYRKRDDLFNLMEIGSFEDIKDDKRYDYY